MSAELSRYDAWLEWFAQQLAVEPDVRAAWIGGSAVTGGWDEHSDLDLNLLCRPGTYDAVYDRLMAGARTRFEPSSVWELPVDSRPDGRQAFLNLDQRPGLLARPARIIDLCVLTESERLSRIDVRRHGVPQVLHDPDSILELGPEDDTIGDGIAQALDQIRGQRETTEWLVMRAARRGHRAEATSLYLRFTLGPVVQLLRIRHCPWRFDYGLRYLHTDLPGGLAERVEELLPGQDLEQQASSCFAWLDALLAEELLPGWPGPDRVHFTVATGARPADVWAALTEPERIRTWLGRVDGVPGPQSRFRVWRNEETGATHQVITWQPHRRLEMTWELPDEETSRLSLTVHPDGRISLTHIGLANPVEYAVTWQRHLEYLLAHLAGTDLRSDAFFDGWDERQQGYQTLLDAQTAR